MSQKLLPGGRCVSAIVSVGPKKKKRTKKRSERVQPVLVEEPGERKRAKRKDLMLYKNPQRAQEIVVKFPNQSLVAQQGMLYCGACRKYISFKEAVDVTQHVFGQQKAGQNSAVAFEAKSEELKRKLKHYAKLVGLAEEEEKKTIIDQATETFRAKLFAESGGKMALKGDTLPQDMTTDRVLVHMTMLKEGIPITKLASEGLIDLIEKPHLSLGGINGVRAVQPIVRSMVISSAKTAVAGRLVGITFDGSKVNFSIEGMLARVLNDDFLPVSLCVGAQALKTSLDSATLRTVIMKHLEEAGIVAGQIVAFSSDSGPPNPTVMKEWNTQAQALYFGQDLIDQQVQWLPCLMHAFSNAGTVLRKALVGTSKEVHVGLQDHGE